MNDKNEEKIETIIGKPVPDGYTKELEKVDSVLDYEKGITKLDDFGKWLFTSSSLVGLLGAGFSTATFAKLNWIGNLLYCLGLFCITVCLVIGAFALAPKFMNYNPNSLNSTRSVIENNLLKNRGLKLRIAGFFFAAAILFAGFAPLTSIIFRTETSTYFRLSHKFMKDNNITIDFNAKNISNRKEIITDVILFNKNGLSNIFYSTDYANEIGDYNSKIVISNKLFAIAFDSIQVKSTWFTNDTTKKNEIYNIYYK